MAFQFRRWYTVSSYLKNKIGGRMKLLETDDWPLMRFIVPAFPEVNIFTYAAKKTTPLGPVAAATVAAKTWGGRVEIIDENNYRGPRDALGLPDHTQLQKECFA